MTPAAISTIGRRPATDDLRAAARDAYRASLTAGAPLSGAALGRQFEMSDRWGRDRVAEVQRDQHVTSDRQYRESAVRDSELSTREGPGENREPDPPIGMVPALAATPPDAQTLEGTDGRLAQGGSWLDPLIILTVAVVAAAASYGHMLEVAVSAGEPLWIAKAFPITVDGLVLAALRRGRQGRWWLALGIAVSVAANMLARYPEFAATAGPVVSAWPPVALFGTHRLLHARKVSER